jgi:hypothetical protein
MVPRQSRLGSSFKGAGQYYLHDRDAATSERVAFTHTENVPTDDPKKALKWMAFTAIHADDIKREAGTPATGHVCEKPVFTFSLSWHPEQRPQKWEMIGAGRSALATLGLEEHEALYVAHSDGVPHLHLIVNTIHPETGKANRLSYSKLRLSRWAEAYEREHGKVYCEQRAENNARRDEGEYVEYREPAAELDFKTHVTRLYHASDSGSAFHEALKQAGFKLAQGKRIVVIDAQGKVHSLSRQIDGVKAKDIRARLAGVDLPLIDEVRSQDEDQTAKAPKEESKQESREQKAKNRKNQTQNEKSDEAEYFDRDAQDRDWQESIIDAALQAANSPESTPQAVPRAQPVPSSLLNALQDRHLAELGRIYGDHARAKLQLATQLDHEYGEHDRKLRAEAERLDHILKNSGFTRKLWLRLTGQISKSADQDLQNMRLTLADSAQRQNEARQALEDDMEQRRRAMEYRHQKDKEELRADPAYAPVILPKPFSAELPEGPEFDEDWGPTFEY